MAENAHRAAQILRAHAGLLRVNQRADGAQIFCRNTSLHLLQRRRAGFWTYKLG